MRTIKTPALNKMLKNKEQSQTIGEFVEWLSQQGYTICRVDKFDRFSPVRRSIEEWLARYFKVNLNKAEEERRALLEQIRKAC